MQRYNELLAFKKEHGHCNVPRKFNTQLGGWIASQRMQYARPNHGSLSTESIGMLEKIGFVWNVSDHNWNLRYGELLAYKRENGHTNVPNNYPQNKELGYWVGRQRKYYRSKEKTLSQEKIDRLNDIGFEWFLGR